MPPSQWALHALSTGPATGDPSGPKRQWGATMGSPNSLSGAPTKTSMSTYPPGVNSGRSLATRWESSWPPCPATNKYPLASAYGPGGGGAAVVAGTAEMTNNNRGV